MIPFKRKQRLGRTFDLLVSLTLGLMVAIGRATLRLYGNAGIQLSEQWATRFYFTALRLDMEIPGSFK